MKGAIIMKITSLILSKAVADYLEKQNYEFSALQSAYIIAKSNKLSVREKHTEWKRLYSTMKDCEIFNGSTQTYYPRLFDYLQRIIALQNEYIEKFFQDEEGIFCLHSAKRGEEYIGVSGNYTRTLQESMHPAEIENRQGVMFEISKRLFNRELEITAILNELGEVFELKIFGAPAVDSNILSMFDYMNVSFPLPFKVGDAVYEIGDSSKPLFIKGISNCGEQRICCSVPSFDGNDNDIWSNDVLILEYYSKPLTEEENRLKRILEKTSERKNGKVAK